MKKSLSSMCVARIPTRATAHAASTTPETRTHEAVISPHRTRVHRRGRFIDADAETGRLRTSGAAPHVTTTPPAGYRFTIELRRDPTIATISLRSRSGTLNLANVSLK